MWFDTDQMLKWLEDWHEQGCPTIKTLPRREEARIRVEQKEEYHKNYTRLWKKAKKFEEIET